MTSDIYFTSSKSSRKQKDTATYGQDEDGQIKRAHQSSTVTTETSRATVHTKTNKDDTVTITSEFSSNQTKNATNTLENQEPNQIERQIWLQSVLTQAEESLEKIINNYEEKELIRKNRFVESLELKHASFDTTQIWSQSNKIGNQPSEVTFLKKQLSLLRSVKDELRKEFQIMSVDRINHTSIKEQQDTIVDMVGTIRTTDNKEINFSLQAGMHHKAEHETIKSYKLVDPLVINFKGNAAELTDLKYAFDLDGDGDKEKIASLKQGSGFLALDLNNDNQINNGLELFGPRTGNGFQELADYDTDGNNWIDENDEIYSKLVVWMKDSYQHDVIKSLKDKGIGAIHLGHIDSDFTMKDSDNTTVGRILHTGVIVQENGAVKTIQQLDLAV